MSNIDDLICAAIILREQCPFSTKPYEGHNCRFLRAANTVDGAAGELDRLHSNERTIQDDMTLLEWIQRLPPFHKARTEYGNLIRINLGDKEHRK